MKKSIRICGIEQIYLDYLRQYDNKVSMDSTQTRKFIGVLFEIGSNSYYGPLPSPKDKHQLISDKAPDFYKLQGGVLGSLI